MFYLLTKNVYSGNILKVSSLNNLSFYFLKTLGK